MKFLIFIFLSLCLFATKAQTAMTPATGSVDSSATEYISCVMPGNPGYMTIQPIITKVANTGSTVAGYCLLQGSIDGTNFVNVPTLKTLGANVYGKALQPQNLWDVDTFTLTNVTTAQTKIWQVSNGTDGTCQFRYIRVAIVMTTTKVTGTGMYFYLKKI